METLGPPTSETMRVGYLCKYALIEELLDASQALNNVAGEKIAECFSKDTK